MAESIESLPGPLRRVLSGTGLNLAKGSAHVGAAGRPAIASVDRDSPDTVNVDDPGRFDSQTLAHEGTHLVLNNLAPGVKVLPRNNASDPYDFGGTDRLSGLRGSGVKLYNLPQEEAASVVQYYQSQGGDKAPAHIQNSYGPWVNDLNDAPLSTIMPTKPGQQGIGTTPRPPVAPSETYNAVKNFKNGETPEGEPDIEAGLVPHKKEQSYPSAPTHPSGKITAWDEKSGLPIVRREDKASEAPDDGMPTTTEPKPANPAKPVTASAAAPKSSEKDEAKPIVPTKLERGQPVQLSSGKTGKIVFLHDRMGIARVALDDEKNVAGSAGGSRSGSTVTVRLSALKPVDSVLVKEHFRRAPGSF
jgi:hypothetical protein